MRNHCEDQLLTVARILPCEMWSRSLPRWERPRGRPISFTRPMIRIRAIGESGRKGNIRQQGAFHPIAQIAEELHSRNRRSRGTTMEGQHESRRPHARTTGHHQQRRRSPGASTARRLSAAPASQGALARAAQRPIIRERTALREFRSKRHNAKSPLAIRIPRAQQMASLRGRVRCFPQ